MEKACIMSVIAIVTSVIFMNLCSCEKKTVNFYADNGEKGSGNIAKEKRSVSNFSKIDVGGVFEVDIIVQKDFDVQIEADDNFLPYIQTNVNGDTLEITTNKILNIQTNVNGDTLEITTNKNLMPQNPLRIKISAPNIEQLNASGASKILLSNVKNKRLAVIASGATKINLVGETENLSVNASGASLLNAINLKSSKVSIDANGASNANVFVLGDLKATLSDASHVTYSGSPKNIQKKTSGVSSVSKN